VPSRATALGPRVVPLKPTRREASVLSSLSDAGLALPPPSRAAYPPRQAADGADSLIPPPTLATPHDSNHRSRSRARLHLRHCLVSPSAGSCDLPVCSVHDQHS
jgi:hypothetical protein